MSSLTSHVVEKTPSEFFLRFKTSGDGFIVLVTGPGDSEETFSGVVVYSGDTGIVGAYNRNYVRKLFMPWFGEITLEG